MTGIKARAKDVFTFALHLLNGTHFHSCNSMCDGGWAGGQGG